MKSINVSLARVFVCLALLTSFVAFSLNGWKVSAQERQIPARKSGQPKSIFLMSPNGISVSDMSSQTPSALVQKIIGNGTPFSNVVYTGASIASGSFSGGTAPIGFEDGILLTSGSVFNVVGPNTQNYISQVNEVPGDASLNSIISGTTGDASVLEFDFVPSANTVTFQYVFASEEYNEYVNSSFNDVFAFFLNGSNVALIPNTSTPVSINNVNNGYPLGTNVHNPQYYRNNDLDDGGGSIDTEMNGLTTVFNVSANVTPNQTNHIKLAIADVTDKSLDSAVFIKSNSFIVTPPTGSFRLGQGGSYSIPEGNSGTTLLNIPVERIGGSNGAANVTLNMTNNVANGGSSCAPGIDFVNTPLTISFPNGVTTGNFSVPICGDVTAENDEIFNISLSNPTNGATLSSPSTGTVFILNDDAQTPAISVTVNPPSVNEDSGAPLTYTFARPVPSASPVFVNFQTVGAATFSPGGGQDYTVATPPGTNYSTTTGIGTITIPSNASSATLTVTPIADSFVETNEDATVVITSGSGYVVGNPSQASGIINNDDALPVISVNVSPPSVLENSGQPFTYTFSRPAPGVSPITVNFSATGSTASFNGPLQDFNVQTNAAVTFNSATGTGTVTIQANQAAGQVIITPILDSVSEPDETVILAIQPSATYTVGNPPSATGTIVNDDQTTVNVTVSPNSVLEDEGSLLVYTFTRSDIGSNLLVNFNLSGTATRTGTDVDYSVLLSNQPSSYDPVTGTGSITIPGGSQSATVTVVPKTDFTIEPDETVVLSLFNGSGYTLGSPNVATGVIRNDDPTCSPKPITFAASLGGVLNDSSCVLSGLKTDLYSFTGQANQQIAITMVSADFITKIDLIDPFGNVTSINGTSAQKNSRLPASGFVTLPNNGTYTIRATSTTGSSGAYNITLFQAPQSGCTYTLSPTQTNAPFSGGNFYFDVLTEPGCPPAATPPASGNYYSNLTYVGGRINFSLSSNPTTATRSETITVAGKTHTINQFGSLAPSNDNFVNATVISGGSGQLNPIGFNTNAGPEPNERSHAGNAASKSVWYRWTAPVDGFYSFTTAGSSIDTVLAVYQTASLPTQGTPEIISNDDTSSFDKSSRVNFRANANQEYRIVVDGKNGASGTFLLSWKNYSRLFRVYALTANGDASPREPVITATKLGGDGAVVPAVKVSLGIYEFDLVPDGFSYRINITSPGVSWENDGTIINNFVAPFSEFAPTDTGGQTYTTTPTNLTITVRGFISGLGNTNGLKVVVNYGAIAGITNSPLPSAPKDCTVAPVEDLIRYTCFFAPDSYHTVVPTMPGKGFIAPQKEFREIINSNRDYPPSDAFGSVNVTTSSITGKVVTAQGQPLGNAKVDLTVGSQTFTKITAPDGIYSFDGLQTGLNYTASAKLAGHIIQPQTVTNLQAAVSGINLTAQTCTYSVTGTTNVGVAGGSNNVLTVTVASPGSNAPCEWIAASQASWITIAAQSGFANGTVQFAAQANTGAARSGAIQIGSQTFSITQDGSTPDVSITVGQPSSVPEDGAANLVYTVSRNTAFDSALTVNFQASGNAAFAAGATKDYTVITTPGRWSQAGSLAATRTDFTATLLNNGKVLVAGGFPAGNVQTPLNSAEIFDPVNRTWSGTGSLNTARAQHTATLLQNGKVLVTGGSTTASAEIYDPVTGTWALTGSLPAIRGGHTATLLANGKVLVAGLAGLPQLYDPATGTFTPTAAAQAVRTSPQAALLQNGKVLLIGGDAANTAELFDPALGTWALTGHPIAANRTGRFTGTVLSNGKVLVAGGNIGTASNTAELYDPVAGTWASTGNMNSPRWGHSAVRMSNGKVLVTAGLVKSAEFYDPATGLWTPIDPQFSHDLGTATLLSDGRVLLASGQDVNAVANTTAEIFDPAVTTFNTTTGIGTITLAPNQSSASIIVDPTSDSSVEQNETVTMTLNSGTGYLVVAPAAATGTITNDDASVTVSVAPASVSEDGTTNLVYTFTRNLVTASPLTVNFTKSGTTDAADYQQSPAGTSVQIPANQASATVTIDPTSDTAVEPDETVILTVTPGTGYEPGNPNSATGTIQNDDSSGSIQFSSATYNVNENGGNAVITVTRAGGTSGAVSVGFTTGNGTAAAGQDYTATNGTLNWAAGESASKTFNVPIADDAIFEGSETVNLTLSNPGGGATLGSQSTAVLTIADNETQPTLSINNVTKSEGNSGTTAFDFTVTLSGQTTQTVTVNYSTANDTATAPSDYTAVPATPLTFTPGGALTRTATVLVNGDTTQELDERFFVNLSGASNATILTGQGIGTIQNDDSAGTIQFNSAAFSVNENGVTAAITATRVNGSSGAVSVQFTTANGTATAGQDYTATSGTLNWADGDSAPKSFNIPITDDTSVEGNETVNLTLSNAGGGATIGNPAAAVLTIVDNDTSGPRAIGDFDGDNKTDVAVWRESNGIWFTTPSGGGSFPAFQFGQPGDKIVPGDYDGDGKADFAVYRPNGGLWYMQRTTAGFTVVQWGVATDIPVPGDYDGDGKTDIAVWRPSSGIWFIQNSGNGQTVATQWGAQGDKLVPGDYDGDGKTDLGVWRPSSGIWFIIRSTQGNLAFQFGIPTDQVVPADYDGDARTDIAVVRPGNESLWYMQRSTAGFDVRQWGTTNDIPVAGDYDGDGRADIAVWRPSNGIWFLQRSTAGFVATQFGQIGDKPIPAAYIPTVP